ncbi:2Fe-2S iron-sulfur cluster-binding protein [Xanthobacter sp. VTT E-85241]|uniref:xanthine dehydrogenase family Fe-S subunit n=1 Tax=Roseixanthobacter finlandensis TaxID=3119922 RepID=UPI00372B6B03
MSMVSLTVNSRPLRADVEPRTNLADFLRDSHDLTGTHLGCEHGVCGACTVIVDGEPVRSCITYAVACENAQVTTIEGLNDDEVAGELRAAFTREHGLQCGYCTPGMIVSARDVVLRIPDASEHEIRVAMSGNLCRCTGYVGIVRAIRSVIAERKARGAAPRADVRTALGPVGSGHAGAFVGSADKGADAPPARIAAPVPRAAPSRVAPPRETAKLDADFVPQTSFPQSFVVAHPVDVVWDFFGRVDEVAACLPGASLVGTPTPEHVEGQIRVKVGPMVAEFQGVADISRDDARHAGRISGSGRDTRSNSATRGLIGYTLTPVEDGRATRVDVSIGYTLTGMLAQFGRSGLVQDIAGRLVSAFVQNLEARLGQGEGAPAAPVVTELNAGSLVYSVILSRLKELWRRIAG